MAYNDWKFDYAILGRPQFRIPKYTGEYSTEKQDRARGILSRILLNTYGLQPRSSVSLPIRRCTLQM
jgi:hypothetical protein